MTWFEMGFEWGTVRNFKALLMLPIVWVALAVGWLAGDNVSYRKA